MVCSAFSGALIGLPSERERLSYEGHLSFQWYVQCYG